MFGCYALMAPLLSGVPVPMATGVVGFIVPTETFVLNVLTPRLLTSLVGTRRGCVLYLIADPDPQGSAKLIKGTDGYLLCMVLMGSELKISLF